MSDKPTSSRDNAEDKKQDNPTTPSLKSKKTPEDLTKNEDTLLERGEVLDREIDAPVRDDDYYQGAVGGVSNVGRRQSEIDLSASISKSHTLSTESSVDESESTNISMPIEFRNIEPGPTFSPIAEDESKQAPEIEPDLPSVATHTTDDTDVVISSLTRRPSEITQASATALVSDSAKTQTSDNTSHSKPGFEMMILDDPDDDTRKDSSNAENEPIPINIVSQSFESAGTHRNVQGIIADFRSASSGSSSQNIPGANVMKLLNPTIDQDIQSATSSMQPLTIGPTSDTDESESTEAVMPSELQNTEPIPTFAEIVDDSEKQIAERHSHLSSVATPTTDDTDETLSSLSKGTSEEINKTSATALVLDSAMYKSSDNTSQSNPVFKKEKNISTDSTSLETTSDCSVSCDTFINVDSLVSDFSSSCSALKSRNIHGANLMPFIHPDIDPDGDTSKDILSLERDQRSDSSSITEISNLEDNKKQAVHSVRDTAHDSDTSKSVSTLNTDITSESLATSSQSRLFVRRIPRSTNDQGGDTNEDISSLEKDTTESSIASSHDSDTSKNASTLITDITSKSVIPSQFGLHIREIPHSSNDSDDDTSKGYSSLQRDPTTGSDTITDITSSEGNTMQAEPNIVQPLPISPTSNPDDMALPREEQLPPALSETRIVHNKPRNKFETVTQLVIATAQWLTLPNEVLFQNYNTVVANVEPEPTPPPMDLDYIQMRRIRESLLNKYTNIRSYPTTESLPGTSRQNLEMDEARLAINAHIEKVKTELLVIDLFDIEHDKTYTACNEILQNFALNIIPQNELSVIKSRLEEYVKVLKETQKSLLQNYKEACIEINRVKEKVNQLEELDSSEYAEEIKEMENRNRTNDKRIGELRKCISDVNTLISKL